MSRAAEPFILPLASAPAVLLGHTLGKVDGHLGVDQAPVLPSSGPFFRNIHHGKIKHFRQTIIRRKYRFGFGDLAQLAVETLNGIGGVDQPAYLLGVLEIGAEISPVDRQDWEIFGYFLSQRSPKASRASKAACSSTAA